jgi:hypothetical protein
MDIDLSGPSMPEIPSEPFDRSLAVAPEELTVPHFSVADVLPPKSRTAGGGS